MSEYQYAKIGVETEKVIKVLMEIPVSLHCWQGDDVKGVDTKSRLQATSRPQIIIWVPHGHQRSVWLI